MPTRDSELKPAISLRADAGADEYREPRHRQPNQPFSGWDQIFPGQAMTVRGYRRFVNHAAYLEN